MNDAYYEGYCAFKDGETCPYGKGCDEYLLWYKGFNDAKNPTRPNLYGDALDFQDDTYYDEDYDMCDYNN